MRGAFGGINRFRNNNQIKNGALQSFMGRRKCAFTRALGAAAAGLGLVPAAAPAMPLDNRVPGALDDWIGTLRSWQRPLRAAALVAASGGAGGIEAAASAGGVGYDLRPYGVYAPFPPKASVGGGAGSFAELQKNEPKRLKSLSRAQNRTP